MNPMNKIDKALRFFANWAFLLLVDPVAFSKTVYSELHPEKKVARCYKPIIAMYIFNMTLLIYFAVARSL